MHIDPAIRDWVMIPLFVLVIVVTYARMYAFRLFAPAGAAEGPEAGELAERNTVARSTRLRTNAGYISFAGFAARKD
jgi:hypothetical protein